MPSTSNRAVGLLTLDYRYSQACLGSSSLTSSWSACQSLWIQWTPAYARQDGQTAAGPPEPLKNRRVSSLLKRFKKHTEDYKSQRERMAVCVSGRIPDPGRMLTTPLGKPTLAVSSANFSAVNGVTWRMKYKKWKNIYAGHLHRNGVNWSACSSYKYYFGYFLE